MRAANPSPSAHPRVPAAGCPRIPSAPALLLALAAALALAGCAGTAESPGSEEPSEVEQPSERAPARTDGVVRHQVDNRAVALLWDDAEQARRSGDLDTAVTKLERAVRLAPEDPVLWSRLAEVRLRQDDFAVAENLAAKSNALAGDGRLLRYRNWLIIAVAREQRGDEEGAVQAREEAERLETEGLDS
ncbi:MAG: tetratricopeptide repeat protein [Halofilum sp. (in: g-proteobacteria)]